MWCVLAYLSGNVIFLSLHTWDSCGKASIPGIWWHHMMNHFELGQCLSENHTTSFWQRLWATTISHSAVYNDSIGNMKSEILENFTRISGEAKVVEFLVFPRILQYFPASSSISQYLPASSSISQHPPVFQLLLVSQCCSVAPGQAFQSCICRGWAMASRWIASVVSQIRRFRLIQEYELRL